MPSLHINAEKKDISPFVLMPGDPLRAKVMSEMFLTDIKQVNNVRGMLGYTGTHQGVKITIMGSGMGMPSIGIYSYELFDYYAVERIIRVGTCGAIRDDLVLEDVILAQSASTDSNYIQQHDLPGQWSPPASFPLLRQATVFCESSAIKHTVANVLSSDFFYHPRPDSWKRWAKLGVACIEMEAAALYANAACAGKEALAILTVSDHIPTGKRSAQHQRESAFSKMFEIGLDALKS